jgi:predicted phosphodiesterase
MAKSSTSKTTNKILILSDIHVPHHDKTALGTALDYLKENRFQMVYINGDFLDCGSVSSFDKRYEEYDLVEELHLAQDVLSQIRKAARNADLIYRFGNHEERYERYITRNAYRLSGIRDIRLDRLLKLDEFKIRFAGDMRAPIWLTKNLALLHGHEIRTSAFINIAKSVFARTLVNTIVGHFHRTQEDIQRDMLDNVRGCWVSGCLCQLRPQYNIVNNWNHGFVEVSVYNTRQFHVQNRKLINGVLL